jgi:3-phosphoglycerate kinase
MLAIVAGDDMLEEVKYIDRMIDIADEVAVAGKIGLVFLAALGHKTGAVVHDPAYLPMARALLAKAQMVGVPITLPVDFVMGNVLVDASSAKKRLRVSDEVIAGDGRGDAEEEHADESAGFDYDGEVKSSQYVEDFHGAVSLTHFLP